jgi:signal transduction histidine kinase
MTARRSSIKRDILFSAFALFAILGVGLFIYLRSFAQDAADTAFDRVLAASTLSIADNVRVDDGRITVELPLAAMEILGSERKTRAFYAVRAPDGSLITGYGDLPDTKTSAQDFAPNFDDAVFFDVPVRICTVRRYIEFGDGSGWVTATVAESREARQQLSIQILRASLAPLGIAGLLTAILIWQGLRRAWAPLVALEAELVRRPPTDLTPIHARVPAEVASLVTSLNGFMQRLDGVLSALRNIAVETAHEIRTPLASIRALAEVATVEADHALLRHHTQRILANTVNATRIVNQLLAEAAMTHHMETTERSACDLLELYLEASERLPMEQIGRCRLTTVSTECDHFLVSASPLALRELIDNLLDNALKYAPASALEVSICAIAAEGMIMFEVADRGPGIPDSEKASVVERFRRGSSGAHVPGTGLGLSIARSVATAAGGRLDLVDRPGGGLIVRALLPMMEAT